MTQRQKVLVVILASLLAMGIKFSLSLAGNNGDLVTYLRLSEMSVQGKDMYLDNQYYNYAPVLYKLLGALRGLAPEPREFRNGLILLYSLADMGISLVLLTQFGLAVALVFALNPLSMLISGFHNQFDCLAILPALLSAVFYKRYEDRGYDVGQLWLFILFFSLSLMTKHNLILLPLVLLWRAKPMRHNLLVLMPWVFFVSSILIYLTRENYMSIWNYVVLYKSHWGTGLVFKIWRAITPYFMSVGYLGKMLDYLVMFVPIIASGYLLRREDPVRLCACVMAMTFAFSPMVANQYVVIPMAFVAINYRNPVHWYFMALSVLFILGHHHGLRISLIKGYMGKQWSILQAPILATVLYYMWSLYQDNKKKALAS